jgi:rod shape-determining protein MreD
MTSGQRRGSWVIILSFLMALILNSVPLPTWPERFRPDWVSLVLIYWCMALPYRVGVATGWASGLVLDAARGAVLGQHALALSVVAFLTLRTHRRVRVFPLWQQAISVLLFLLVNQLLVFWINGIIGYPPDDFWYLAPALGGMLFWPWVFILLRDARRRFRVG